MSDRAKVIEGLELCTNISPDGCLMLCPYKDEQDETYSGFCEQVLKQDALAMLKDQEAEIRQLRLALDIAKGTCKGIKFGGGQFADMPTMQSAT